MIGRPTLSDSMPLFYKGLSGRCTSRNRHGKALRPYRRERLFPRARRGGSWPRRNRANRSRVSFRDRRVQRPSLGSGAPDTSRGGGLLLWDEPGESNPAYPRGTDVELGDCAIQVLLTPGHTPTNVSIYAPQDGVLFCGDCLVNGYMPNLDCCPGMARSRWGTMLTASSRAFATNWRGRLQPG
jgi:glyoxylase-like metal-dependent hydrolase (beta-lactamase superfamily II)